MPDGRLLSADLASVGEVLDVPRGRIMIPEWGLHRDPDRHLKRRINMGLDPE